MNRNPDFVQRMRSRNKNPYIPLHARYSLDYMGNSYFETGSLAKTIRDLNMQPALGLFSFRLDQQEKINIHVVFHPDYYTQEGAEDIIRRIWEGKIWMEEHTGFDSKSWNLRRDTDTPNAWFEIERGLFWTWEKINLADMLLTFRHHVQFLDYNRHMRNTDQPEVRAMDFDRKIHIPNREPELKTFQLYWIDGRHHTIKGNDIADAFRRAGWGGGALAAVDWYDERDTLTHRWDSEQKVWVPLDTSENPS